LFEVEYNFLVLKIYKPRVSFKIKTYDFTTLNGNQLEKMKADGHLTYRPLSGCVAAWFVCLALLVRCGLGQRRDGWEMVMRRGQRDYS
jgi:hypothetical protein